MPVLLERGAHAPVVLGGRPDVSPLDFSPSRSLDLALVNNMPDSALEGTERQFAELLSAAAGDLLVRLKLFSLPSVARAPTAQLHLDASYGAIDSLWNSRPDGLIVTGTEPRAAELRQEPYWAELSHIIDWAQYTTLSTIWSCLAAHAAVLHLDGVGRRLLPQKRSGVFDCENLGDHPITRTLPSTFCIPHSRCNDLDQHDLRAAGYSILSRSPQAGVDSFVKRSRSTFVFFQGHPEYDSGTLFREYRRDVGRFLSGERPNYPAMPEGYFGADAGARLSAFEARAHESRAIGLLADFPVLEQDIAARWRPTATQMYRNWLALMAAEKAARTSLPPRTFKRPARTTASYAGSHAVAVGGERRAFGVAVAAPAGRPKA